MTTQKLPSSTPLSILLVEDSKHDAIAFQRALDKGRLAAEITHCWTAEEAMKSLHLLPLPYDLVVSDHKLPGQTGLELCQQIFEEKIPVPCVIVTGAGTEYIAVEALKAGVFDYLVKDFQQHYLEILPLLLPEIVRKYQDEKLARILTQEKQTIAAISELFLAQDGTPDLMYEKLPQILAAEFSFPISMVMLLTDDKKAMVVKGIAGDVDQKFVGTRLPLDQSACSSTILAGEPTLLTDLASSPELHCFLKGYAIQTCLSIPIKANRSGTLGSLTLNDTRNRFDADLHIQALQVIANHLGQELERELLIKKLKASEERYEDLYENAPGMFASVEAKSATIIQCNQTIARNLGYTKEEIVGRSIKELYPPADEEKKRQVFKTFTEKGTVRDAELQLLRKDGSRLDVILNVSSVRDEQGKILYSRSIWHDNTNAKLAERSQREWSAAMDASEDAVYILDVHRHLLTANKAFYGMTGTTPETALGHHVEPLVHPQGEVVPCPVCQAQNELRDTRIIMEPEHPDNPTGRPIEITVTIVRDDQGQPLSILMRLHDLTAQRKIEGDIRRAKREWEKTFDAMSDIVTIQDTDMRIIRANRAAHLFFQVQPGELTGKLCYEIFTGRTEPCPGCPLLDSLHDSGHHAAIMKHENLGKTFHISSSIIAVDKNHNEDVQYLIHVARDITDQKKMEEELFQSHKMEAIGTLAGGIAHDFNNILSAIIGFTELARLGLDPDSHPAADLAMVLQASKRATGLVSQILAFSRKGNQRREALQPHLIVKEALKLIRASLPTTIEIREDIDPESGAILANPTSIHQIIINLCTNALQAMEDETGILKVTLTRRTLNTDELLGHPGIAPGPFLELSVSDTGCGMDQETQKRIFEPYFTTKEVGKGSGLGLAVVLGIVQDYGGMIRVESQPGQGATFHVYFPAILEESGKAESTEGAQPLPGGTEKILTVDDESAIVSLHKAALSRLGYEVTTMTNSQEALSAFKKNPDAFDLLITDQTMPFLSGAKLAREVMAIRPDLPIILCTGYSTVLSEEQALAIGIKKYLFKPVDYRDLARQVRTILDGN